MTTPDLLPPNATALERNLARVVSRIGDLPVPVRDLWNPAKIPAGLIPWLAWALSVEEAWPLAQTDAERRSVIARAVEIHKHKGTPYAVRRGLEALGYAGVEIEEGLPILRHDGTRANGQLRNGLEDYNAGRRWALFRIVLDLGNTKGFVQSDFERVAETVDLWKNARSHLYAVGLKATLRQDREVAPVAGLGLGVHIAASSYRPGCRDGSLRRAAETRYRRNSAHRFDGSAPRSGPTFEGLAFGKARSERLLAVDFTHEDARRRGIPREGSIRYSGDFVRRFAGPIDVTPVVRAIELESARGQTAPIEGFLAVDDPAAWAEGRPLDGPVYGQIRIAPARDGTVLRNGSARFGYRTQTYHTQQGQTVFYTLWDYGRTEWDSGATVWDAKQ